MEEEEAGARARGMKGSQWLRRIALTNLCAPGNSEVKGVQGVGMVCTNQHPDRCRAAPPHPLTHPLPQACPKPHLLAPLHHSSATPLHPPLCPILCRITLCWQPTPRPSQCCNSFKPPVPPSPCCHPSLSHPLIPTPRPSHRCHSSATARALPNTSACSARRHSIDPGGALRRYAAPASVPAAPSAASAPAAPASAPATPSADSAPAASASAPAAPPTKGPAATSASASVGAPKRRRTASEDSSCPDHPASAPFLPSMPCPASPPPLPPTAAPGAYRRSAAGGCNRSVSTAFIAAGGGTGGTPLAPVPTPPPTLPRCSHHPSQASSAVLPACVAASRAYSRRDSIADRLWACCRWERRAAAVGRGPGEPAAAAAPSRADHSHSAPAV